jgi:HEAT repeat protein
VRVVPWYLEALREASTLVVPRALDGLSRFDSDPALEGIRSVMTSEDGNVRHTAAIALSLSPHAEAKRLLWTMIDDPRQALRMVVVRAAGEADSEATAVLEHAVDDPDATVSATARALLGRETTRR